MESISKDIIDQLEFEVNGGLPAQLMFQLGQSTGWSYDVRLTDPPTKDFNSKKYCKILIDYSEIKEQLKRASYLRVRYNDENYLVSKWGWCKGEFKGFIFVHTDLVIT